MTDADRSPPGAACHEPLAAARERMEEEVWTPLRDALGAARKAHRGCREETGLHRPQPPEDAPGPRERILDYLTELGERVHRPLREALDDGRPLTTSATLLKEALEAAESAAAALPESAPAPGGETGGSPGALRRMAVGLRGTGEGEVPLRWLARRHVVLRLARGADRWTGLVAREWAVWLADLEVAWARWAGAVLRTLPPPAQGDPEAAWQVATAAADALDEALGGLEDRAPLAPLAGEMDGDLAHWASSLSGDVEVSGTFLLRTGGPLPRPPRPRTDVEAWGRWEDEVGERFELHAHLLETMTSLPALAARVSARLGADLRAGWRARAEAAADELEALAGGLELDGLDAPRRRADAALAALSEARPTTEAFEAATTKAADGALASLQALLRGLPESLTLHPPVDADQLPRRPSPQGRVVRLRELGRNAFDALRVERVRTAPEAVVPLAGTLSAELSGVSEVVAFGFDAAGREVDGGDEGAGIRAVELASEGLARAAEALRGADAPLGRALEEVEATLASELHAGAATLAERALADRLEGTLLEARSRLAASWEGFRTRAGGRVLEAVRLGRRHAAGLRRRAERLARRGREMVTAREEVTVGTGRLLSAPEEVRAGLPLVYQRLFSWEPVEDETLLAGREAELAEAGARLLRWRQGDGVPLLVTGRPGVGVSSFVRVLVGRVAAGGIQAVHRVLERRITEEAVLAGRLADLLELPAVETLDDLAAAILGAPHGSLPDLVAVEGLEQLYLRVPGGTDLLERLLTLMSETEPRIFWMGAVTSSAWQLLQTTEATAVSQVDRLDLPSLDTEGVRQAILMRHRRSGVPLRYEEPPKGRRLLRRRLARTRGREARQELLEKDFFERLYRVAGGNLRLAIFQWIRAADFQAHEGAVTLRPRKELDLSFLDALSPSSHFTLKAFLEHGTLTLEEHDRIFRLPRQESYQIFEALGNRHVIQLVPGSDSGGTVSEAADSARYRINPLLLGGVGAVLGGRNILH